MPLQNGTRLGPYEILESAGAGGMGEVYKARDSRLDRTVAVKVLPSEIASRPDLRERFDREARAASSLSHPNICAIHDVGHQDGVDYIVMEYLEGETLAARLEKGPLTLAELLPVAVQLSEALDAAHRKGFMHRDIKPGNIMLTRSGAKLLDFGLAKSAFPGAAGAGSMTAAPTATSPLTAEGTIVGTFQYMAPEQLEGAQADARSDIFSFGAVLYEMAAGTRAFEGKTQASLAASILKEEPRPLSALAPMTPPALERVVRICLAKEPEDRWQTARDLARELRWISEAGSQAGLPAPVAARRRTRERLWMISALVLAAALVVTAGLWFASRPPAGVEESQIFADILPPPNASFVSSGEGAGPAVISADGTKIAYSAVTPGVGQQIWVRDLTTGGTRALKGTENGYRPFWSPDGKYVGFFAGAKLKKIELLSGATLSLADASAGRGGSWSPDGTIIYTPNYRGPVYAVDSGGGGTPRAVTEMDADQREGTHRFPSFLPDGRHFFFLSRRSVAGTPEDTAVWVASLDSPERKRLMRAESNAIYASGYLLFARQKTLLAQPFDLQRLELTGEPTAVAQGVLVDPVFSLGVFSASGTGTLVYQVGNVQDKSKVVWLDRKGNETGTLVDEVAVQDVRISPDAGRVAVSIDDPGPGRNIWIQDLARGIRSRLTFASDAVEGLSQWSPDGKELLYSTTADGSLQIYRKATSGAGKSEHLIDWKGDAWPTSWSPDGKHVLFTSLSREKSESGSDVMSVSTDPDSKPEPYVATSFAEDSARFSPDGRWVAYTSDESSRMEVYVAPFPNPDGKWQISSAGGDQPHWRHDGKELFYLAPGGRMMAVEVDGSGADLKVGKEQLLFTHEINTSAWQQYDNTPDGQRFLLVVPERQNIVYPITLDLNWTAALGKH